MVYKIISTILTQCNADLSAAEAHGIATGMLCANEHADSAQWLGELLRNAAPVSDDKQNLLIRLFEETGRLLTSDGFEFELFLPEDTIPLSEQIVALKDWCQGFLYGVGFSASKNDWPPDVREIVKDIAEFTKLETHADSEEDENAFTEITEYLRSVVVLVRDDLNEMSENQAQ